MESDDAGIAGSGRPVLRPGGLSGAIAEIVLVALLFAAAGAWPTPDTNEAHYLTRARHGHDPAWLAGDFFLESREAHGVFSRLLGPLTTVLPLDRAAWVGRVAGWAGLACGFTYAASAVLASRGWRLVAAALFSLAVRHTTAAGEWVIGGCEAKVFAWALVAAGAGCFARGRPIAAWVVLGAATAFHPLVGGWAMLALLAAAFACGREAVDRPGAARHPSLLLAGVLVGALLAAVGVVPALGLSAGVPPDERARAAYTYVVERLPHHLLVRTFADGMVARHVLAVGVWWLLLPVTPTAAERRLAAFTAAAVGVSLAGACVSLLEGVAPATAHALLRYYWFRLADGVVPLGLSLAAAGAIASPGGRLGAAGRRRMTLAALAALVAVDLVVESRHWPLPGRPAPVARAEKTVQAPAWQKVCAWVRENTPPDACFLTPRGASSFHWHAARREVVCWKNIPQDPAAILEWRRRIVDCFSVDGSLKTLVSSTAVLGGDRLLEVARKYGADHVIVPVNPLEPYPLPGAPLHVVGGYAVHRIDPPPPAP